MEALLTPQFFTQFGLAGVVLFLAYKAITKLYADMREDSQKREDKLLSHLDRVTDTLQTIDKRLSSVEDYIRKE